MRLTRLLADCGKPSTKRIGTFTHMERGPAVVDVTNFNDRTWFDRAGNFHSDALHRIERFTPISPDAIHYEVTIEDPN